MLERQVQVQEPLVVAVVVRVLVLTSLLAVGAEVKVVLREQPELVEEAVVQPVLVLKVLEQQRLAAETPDRQPQPRLSAVKAVKET